MDTDHDDHSHHSTGADGDGGDRSSNSDSSAMSDKPRSIEELTRAAKYKFEAVPEFFALITGTQDPLQQAKVYEAEDDLESAYILLCRSYKMSIEEIPKHHDFPTSGQAVADRLVSISARALRDMLRLRPLLEANHQAWMESRSLRSDERRHNSVSNARDPSRSPASSMISIRSIPIQAPSGSRPTRDKLDPPSASDSPYIPMVQTKDGQRRPYVRAISSPPSQQGSRVSSPAFSAGGHAVSNRWQIPPSLSMSATPGSRPASMPPSSPAKLKGLHPGPLFDRKRIQSPTMSDKHQHQDPHSQQPQPQPPLPLPLRAGYQYQARKPATIIPIATRHSLPTMPARALPASPLLQAPQSVPVRIPIRSLDEPTRRDPRSPSPTVQLPPTVTGSRTNDWEEAEDEHKSRLRTLLLSQHFIDMFVAVASASTDMNIETCGFIMGHLRENILIANLLIIPKQTGTSDTCTTMNEEEIWNVTDQEGVIFLGWIHTHPRHDCFLSSKDLHTQAGYQQLLPEAIAIVIAPTAKNQSIGIFRLTAPPGLSIITNCRQGNDFHPHYEAGPLYVNASGGKEGHVLFMSPERLKARVIDLRD